MSVVVSSPYPAAGGMWLKGNLHTHTTNSDGPLSPQETIDAYAARGYDFLMLSDHDQLSDVTALDHRGMVLIPGNEISADGPHMLHVNATKVIAPNPDRQVVIDAVNADGGFTVVNHPNWESSFSHCPQERLEEWNGYAGIEIFNGIIGILPGSPLATDRWDRLLGGGRRIWGYGTDDCHRLGDLGVAWTVVQADKRTAADLVSSLREGRFYASTGVVITRVAAHGRTIHIETANAQHIKAYSDYAYREASVDGAAMTFIVPEDTSKGYVRFECWGAGDKMAWTQPFFIAPASQQQ